MTEQKPDTSRYACPNCNGSGGLPCHIAFAGICTWCWGHRSLTSAEIKEKREARTEDER